MPTGERVRFKKCVHKNAIKHEKGILILRNFMTTPRIPLDFQLLCIYVAMT
jgi:hypothetical protein